MDPQEYVFCVRHDRLSGLKHCHQLQRIIKTLDAAKQAMRDSEMRARIGGVAVQMEKYDFFFRVELGSRILSMTDNLSRSLQGKTISACEGQKPVSLALAIYQSIHSEDCFDLFWEYVEGRRSKADFHRDLTKAKVHLNTPVRQRITIRGYISKVLI